MPKQQALARYISHYCKKYLLQEKEEELMSTWALHYNHPRRLNCLVNPATDKRPHRVIHKNFKKTVEKIAKLDKMNPMERKILIRILRFMQDPEKALSEGRKPQTQGQPDNFGYNYTTTGRGAKQQYASFSR